MSETQINEQNEKGLGNTISSPYQHKYWCFTLNNYTNEQIEHIEHIFKYECLWYIFQEEAGENNTPHLQGTLCLKERQRMTSLKQWCPAIHWEPTRSVKASIVYCTKHESRIGKIYSKGVDIPEQLDLEQPYGWQLQVMDIIKEKPDKRTIHWFWEPKGNVGKTTLCKYLVGNHDALMLTGKSNDMYHVILKYPKKRKIILIDVPRSTQDYINYGALEHIKGGLIFSGKYDGDICVFNSPHVIVFANEPPDLSKMSKDRWHIVGIPR